MNDHGFLLFTWCHFLIPGQRPWAIWSNKNCHSWKIPPICLKILFDMDSIQYLKQNDQVLWRCLIIWDCERLSIPKALHINVWEMAGVTAMAAGGEQTQSAHACDVSLRARIRHRLLYDAMNAYLATDARYPRRLHQLRWRQQFRKFYCLEITIKLWKINDRSGDYYKYITFATTKFMGVLPIGGLPVCVLSYILAWHWCSSGQQPPLVYTGD